MSPLLVAFYVGALCGFGAGVVLMCIAQIRRDDDDPPPGAGSYVTPPYRNPPGRE